MGYPLNSYFTICQKNDERRTLFLIGREIQLIVFHRLRMKCTILIAKTIVLELPFFKKTNNLFMFHVESSQIDYRATTILFFCLRLEEEDKIQ